MELDRVVLDELLERAGAARFVLLGEATHGTHEFYELRAGLTRRLLAEHGFGGVALEADWPAAARADRYVQGHGPDHDAIAALGDFVRFPRWMWRNRPTVALVEWLRARGDGTGLHGLDLYSLHESIAAVVAYLDAVDPDAANRARARYACFEDLGARDYAAAIAAGAKEPCEDDVVAQLCELRERTGRDDCLGRGARFAAEQNARLAAGAERYYRALFHGQADSWNLRDAHMADTLDALADFHDGAGIVAWAHNSHVGDARATSMAARGELSLGQLMRERHGAEVLLVGFTTYAGTVTAARDWGAATERRSVRPALAGSLERRLHDAGVRREALHPGHELLADELIQRMIGAVYQPECERLNHYLATRAAAQFDIVVHIDETTALEPLDGWSAVA
jgi:erythromycin esterase-like protein